MGENPPKSLFMQKIPRFHYLPEDNPVEFGRIVRELTLEVFCLSPSESASIPLSQAIKDDYYAVHDDFPKGINDRGVRDWFNGELDAGRGKLTPERFRFVIEALWKRGALFHIVDVFSVL